MFEINETTNILEGSLRSLIQPRAGTDPRGQRDNQDIGRISTITETTSILEWSSRSTNSPKAQMDLRDQ